MAQQSLELSSKLRPNQPLPTPAAKTYKEISNQSYRDQQPRAACDQQPGHTMDTMANFYSSALIGLFLGFVFGVGCALAVMYSIYMGGYRAAVKDAQLPSPPRTPPTSPPASPG